MKRTFVVVVALAATLAGCGGDPTPSADGAGGSPRARSDVTLEAIAFEPSRLEIETGTTVTWTNEDEGVAHTVTSGTPKKEGIPGLSEDKEGKHDGVFNGELPDAGDTFEFTFDEPGTYRYFCAIHAPMTGTIVVE